VSSFVKHPSDGILQKKKSILLTMYTVKSSPNELVLSTPRFREWLVCGGIILFSFVPHLMFFSHPSYTEDYIVRYSLYAWTLVFLGVGIIGIGDSETASFELGKKLVITRQGWGNPRKYVVPMNQIHELQVEKHSTKNAYRVVVASGEDMLKIPLTDAYFLNEESVRANMKTVEAFLQKQQKFAQVDE